MKIKKFHAKTTREALMLVKAELGPDAVILKIHEPKNVLGKSEGVEVTAALDEATMPAPAMPEPILEGVGASGGVGYDRKGVKKVQWRNLDEESKILDSSKSASGGLIGKMDKTIHEVQALRQDFHHLRDEIKSGAKDVGPGKIPPEFQALSEGLAGAGIQSSLIQELVAELMITCAPEDRVGTKLLAAARKAISQRIPVSTGLPQKKGRSAVVMLVGPTGVGKSTTIAKIAGREVLRGNHSVAILTTDCYRMGALEQMQSFASAANIELETVFSPEDVQESLERLRHHNLVLVDTAGRSRNNREHLEELKAFVAAVHPDEVHLVLSLNTRDRDLLEAVALFKDMGVNRILFTKQDETYELGSLYWLPLRTKIPLSFICTGQRIPDDIQDAQKEVLAGWVLGEVAL